VTEYPAVPSNRPSARRVSCPIERPERVDSGGFDGFRGGSGSRDPVGEVRPRHAGHRRMVPRRMGESSRFLPTQS
jgi:hypothetical protein